METEERHRTVAGAARAAHWEPALRMCVLTLGSGLPRAIEFSNRASQSVARRMHFGCSSRVRVDSVRVGTVQWRALGPVGDGWGLWVAMKRRLRPSRTTEERGSRSSAAWRTCDVGGPPALSFGPVSESGEHCETNALDPVPRRRCTERWHAEKEPRLSVKSQKYGRSHFCVTHELRARRRQR